MERKTKQSSAIRQVLESAHRPLSPQEVLDAAQHLTPGLGIATVYRNLKAMVDEGALTPVHLPDTQVRYEASHHGHHHHFQCTHCSKVYDVHACPGDLSNLAPPGFTVNKHELTLYGLCGECNVTPQKKAKAKIQIVQRG